MAINYFNLYYNTFGIAGNRLPVDHPHNELEPVPVVSPEIADRELTRYGTPYFQRTKINGAYLPNEPLVSIIGGKQIVKTLLDGRDGTFKENMALDDYKITIRGICVDEDNPEEYPEDQVRQIRQVYEEKEAVDVVNDLLTLFGINSMVVDTLEIEAIAGSNGMQAYIINCLSDKEFDLELKDA